MTDPSTKPNEPAKSKTLSGPALIAALVVMGAWLLLLLWLALNTGVEEVAWSRLLIVLGSLEAVVFGAAGALFGTQIQKERVRDAKKHAADAEAKAAGAERRASENADAAIKGKTLAAVVKTKGRNRGARSGTERLSTLPEGEHDQDEVVALAYQLFPD